VQGSEGDNMWSKVRLGVGSSALWNRGCGRVFGLLNLTTSTAIGPVARQNIPLDSYSLSHIGSMYSNPCSSGRAPPSTKPPLVIAYPNINTYNTRDGY